jgi:hypothetical protein
VRHGTTSLFAALDVASGFVIGKCYKRHRAAEFLSTKLVLRFACSGNEGSQLRILVFSVPFALAGSKTGPLLKRRS